MPVRSMSYNTNLALLQRRTGLDALVACNAVHCHPRSKRNLINHRFRLSPRPLKTACPSVATMARRSIKLRPVLFSLCGDIVLSDDQLGAVHLLLDRIRARQLRTLVRSAPT